MSCIKNGKVSSAVSVFEYYNKKLGEAPKDVTLQELPLNSPCGKVCKEVIDAATALLKLCPDFEAAPQYRFQVLSAVDFQIEVFWRG